MLELWQDPFDHWIGFGSPGRERFWSGRHPGRIHGSIDQPDPPSPCPAITPSQWGTSAGDPDFGGPLPISIGGAPAAAVPAPDHGGRWA